MNRKIFPVFGLFLILAVGFGLSSLQIQSVQAEPVQYPTDEQAFLAVLGDYMSYTGETADWKLGEIKKSGKFAITIAQAGESVTEYDGFALMMARQDEAGEWTAVAPEVVENSVYNQWLAEMPDDLVNPFEKSYYYLYDDVVQPMFTIRSVPLHRFPWAINFQARLTQKDGSYHTSQLDFVMRTIDDIYASKPGLVIFVKDSSSVGGCDMSLWSWANMVVVQHSATEFTWYVHLKTNSATVNVGDLIGYGTKIGEQGNTGFACGTTGIHLHYMASNAIPSGWPDPNIPNYAPWPPSGSIYPIDFVESSYASLVEDNVYISSNASPPGACNSSPTQVNMYDNTYCNSSLYSTGAAGFLDLIDLGVDAKLESIEIPVGWSVSLYLDQNELGPKACLNQSDSMLWDNLFSNGVRVANNVLWARLYPSPDCPYPNELGITLYPEPNFVGTPLWGVVGEITSNEPGNVVGSVYVPDGYSAILYDQDDLAGNSVCLSGSALDLAQVSGWSGGAVESVSLILGEHCDPAPPAVPQPVLIKPENNGVVYKENPEVCWEVDGSGLSFNVQIFDNDAYDESSGWIEESCWVAPGLADQTGVLSWRVQARNSDLEVSTWSATFQFSVVEDTNPPTAYFLNLEEGDKVHWPRESLGVSAEDAETSVAKVHFFAWYDDGSEAGYDWHYLGADEDGSDGWRIGWNLVPVVSEDAAVWAYVEDQATNYSSVFLDGLIITNEPISIDGFTARGSGGQDNEGESTVPEENVEEPQGSETSEAPNVSEPETGSTQPEEPEGSNPVNEVEEPVVVVRPNPSAVVTPVFNEVFYQPEKLKLCWEAGPADKDLSYKVEISGEKDIDSPWLRDVCWQPSGLAAGSGSYTWRVKTRETGVGESGWSAQGAFRLAKDEMAPLVEFLSPESGVGIKDEVLIQLAATDEESGLGMAQILVWYDEGQGASWHQIGEEEFSDGKIELVWDISTITPQKVQLWTYVSDQAGNLGSAMVPEVHLGTETASPPETNKYNKSLPDNVVLARGQ